MKKKKKAAPPHLTWVGDRYFVQTMNGAKMVLMGTTAIPAPLATQKLLLRVPKEKWDSADYGLPFLKQAHQL